MCFGGGSSGGMPSIQVSAPPAAVAPPEPAAAPAPTITPSSSSPQTVNEARRKRIFDMTRYGMRSTIKTSPQGIQEAALVAPAGSANKEKLGS